MGEIASRGQLWLSLLRWALVCVPLVLLLGIGSGQLAGSGSNNAWFVLLEKPSFMPPGWLFGVAWTILYVLMGTAIAVVINARGAAHRGQAIMLFIAQLLLNLAWSPLFFAAHQVTYALWLIVALTLLTALTVVRFFQVRTLAGVLMLPYLAWLLFASALNFTIDRMNPGAETLAPGGDRTQITL